MNRITIVERTLTALAIIALLGGGAWFVQTTFQPVPVPPSTYALRTVQFRADLDVSKQDAFFKLRSLGPTEIIVPPAGRPDPFLPIPPPITTTTTTSTVEATSTQP